MAEQGQIDAREIQNFLAAVGVIALFLALFGLFWFATPEATKGLIFMIGFILVPTIPILIVVGVFGGADSLRPIGAFVWFACAIFGAFALAVGGLALFIGAFLLFA